MIKCTGGQEHCAFKHPAIIQTDRNQRWNQKEYVNYTSFLPPVCYDIPRLGMFDSQGGNNSFPGWE